MFGEAVGIDQLYRCNACKRPRREHMDGLPKCLFGPDFFTVYAWIDYTTLGTPARVFCYACSHGQPHNSGKLPDACTNCFARLIYSGGP